MKKSRKKIVVRSRNTFVSTWTFFFSSPTCSGFLAKKFFSTETAAILGPLDLPCSIEKRTRCASRCYRSRHTKGCRLTRVKKHYLLFTLMYSLVNDTTHVHKGERRRQNGAVVNLTMIGVPLFRADWKPRKRKEKCVEHCKWWSRIYQQKKKKIGEKLSLFFFPDRFSRKIGER